MEQQSWAEWLAGDLYRSALNAVIRPKRCKYATCELGPKKFVLRGCPYRRQDLQLQSSKGDHLECSHYRPEHAGETARPCVIFLHGCSSSRLEAVEVLPFLLPNNLDVFSLDFAGSGISGGEYVSFGLNEEKDLGAVIRHLRKSGLVTSIALWGRSMGAATAILRASKDRCLAACVLDSSFVDLRTLAGDFVRESMIPQVAINLGIESLRRDVLRRAGFDLDGVLPIKSAPRAKCPALFAVAFDDTFVLPHHTKALQKAWGGQSTLHGFAGGHNGERPRWFLLEAAEFLKVQCDSHASSRRELPLQPLPEVKGAASNPFGCMLPRSTLLKVPKGRFGTKVLSDRMPPPSPPALMVAARHAAGLVGLAEKRRKEARPLEKCPPDVEAEGLSEAAALSDGLRPSTCPADPLPVASSQRRSFHGAAIRFQSNVARLVSARGQRDERRARRLLQL